MSESSSSGGIGCGMLLAVLLTVLFVGLKLAGIITWSWLWVISPIPILIGFGLLCGALFFLAVLLIGSGIGIVNYVIDTRLFSGHKKVKLNPKNERSGYISLGDINTTNRRK